MPLTLNNNKCAGLAEVKDLILSFRHLSINVISREPISTNNRTTTTFDLVFSIVGDINTLHTLDCLDDY